MLVTPPLRGGASSQERLRQSCTRLLLIRTPTTSLEHGFDDDGIHETHKDPEWPRSHVSVAPRCEIAPGTEDPSMEMWAFKGRVVSGMDASRSPPRRVLLPLRSWGLAPEGLRGSTPRRVPPANAEADVGPRPTSWRRVARKTTKALNRTSLPDFSSRTPGGPWSIHRDPSRSTDGAIAHVGHYFSSGFTPRSDLAQGLLA